MIRSRTTFRLVVALAAAPAPATHALVTSHLSGDAEFLALAPVLTFVAEGRIGDRGGAATFELDLGAETAAPATTAQYDWLSGVVEPFSLSYDSGSQLVTFVLGGKTLLYTTASGTLTDIFVRTRAVNLNTTVVVSDLILDGDAVGDVSSATGDGIDYLRILGGTLADGFVLTGNATLTWSGTAPTQSRLAFQIKLGTTDEHVGVESATWNEIKALYR